MDKVEEVGLPALRAFVFSDQDLAWVCAEVLTVLIHGEALVETLNFDEVDVTVDRPRDSVTFEGVLSTDDDTVTLRIARFVDLAGSIAEPWTGADLATWHEKRRRRVRPMPPVGE